MRNADDQLEYLDPDSATPAEATAAGVLDARRATRGSSSRPKAVAHFTPAERIARGKAARGELPRSAHGAWEAAAETHRPGRSPRGAGADASARARPDPVRAHARVAVHLLPRRRLPDGGRSRGRAADGPARSALRRRAPLQLRHLRRAGSAARLQHQRLRRDAAGAVRVGRQAARRQPRGRRPGSRLRRSGPPLGRDWRRRASTAKRWPVSRRCATSTSGTRASTSRRSSTSSEDRRRASTSSASRSTSPRCDTKDSMRALAKLCRTVDGELRIVGNPPLVTPIEDVLPSADQDHLEDVVRRMIRTYRRTLPRDRRNLLEGYRYVHAARKVVGVGSVGARCWILLMVGRDHKTRSSCSSRRHRPRCWNRSSARASTRNTASTEACPP